MQSSQTNLLDLPTELNFSTALQLDLPSLYSLCLTNTRLGSICQSENFWKQKYQLDYGNQSFNVSLPWKDQYRWRYVRQINHPLAFNTKTYSIIDQNGVLSLFNEKILYKTSFQLEDIIKINIPHKVISFSSYVDHGVQEYVALTEKGVYSIDVQSDTYTSKLILDSESLTNKPIKILTGKLGYILLMDNGDIIWVENQGSHIGQTGKINIFKTLGVINIFKTLGSERYYFLGNDKKLSKSDFYQGDRELTIKRSIIDIPEPVKEYVGDGNVEFVITELGNVYVWGEYFYDRNGNKMDERRIIEKPEKLDFPEPITSISVYNRSMAATTLTGKLYVWGNNYHDKLINSNEILPLIPDMEETEGFDPEKIERISLFMKRSIVRGMQHGMKLNQMMLPMIIQINIGPPVIQVSLGLYEILVLTNDGVINTWGIKNS